MEVRVSDTVGAPPDAVEAALDPESIVEYADSYEVTGVESEGDGHVLDLRTEKGSDDPLMATFEFTPLDDGYTYAQRGDSGPFEEMRTWVRLEGRGGETRIVARSEFTFGGPLWFVLDRLAVKYRRRELERLVGNLVADVDGTAHPESG